MSIYDNFEFSEAELLTIQNELAEKLREVAKTQHIERFKIAWVEPNAAIVDAKGLFVKIRPRSQVVECGDNGGDGQTCLCVQTSDVFSLHHPTVRHCLDESVEKCVQRMPVSVEKCA